MPSQPTHTGFVPRSKAVYPSVEILHVPPEIPTAHADWANSALRLKVLDAQPTVMGPFSLCQEPEGLNAEIERSGCH